jgi:hypothetical protein
VKSILACACNCDIECFVVILPSLDSLAIWHSFVFADRKEASALLQLIQDALANFVHIIP